MPSVQTVLGPKPAGELGQVLMHEHLIFELPGWDLDPTNHWDREATLNKLTTNLVEAKQAGLGTFVDLTAIGVTRDLDLMQEAAKRSGVNIVACTGWWIAAGIPHYFQGQETAQLAKIMIKEIVQGISGSGARAGIIKVGTSLNEIHPAEEKVLRAAGRAQRETGCLISTHTTRSTMGLEQIGIFKEEGADLERVIIGHSDDRSDLDYHRGLLDQGAGVQFDHIGVRFGDYIEDEVKAQMLATLVAEGHAERLTLSHDSVGDMPGRPGFFNTDPGKTFERKPSLIFTTFIPKMRAAGVPEAAIHTMMVSNPARLLAF